MLADSFSGLDSLVFHFGGEFYSTDNYEEKTRIRLDKILRKKILDKKDILTTTDLILKKYRSNNDNS